ncbi:hypothetical protein PHLGIDRAFT_266342 [Phlebiopsis gigantea 11061_1 CR5-6]|uniref:Uncharacterized protein n=1 Tax=Phlebiopsis gigantea (strain 11061_1 CR5-6) TaxID=745531 RepID=A0A0C3SE52_PHLG1|nr:hypothetical protein PHLGIDRAFT_266342 [Phlebiopsis gigantea 11061_1 CR5-6]
MPTDSQAQSTIAELKALSDLIQASLTSIEATMTARSLDFPSPHTTMTMESEGPRMIPEVDEACSLIVSAAMQLIYSVRSPILNITVAATQHAIPAALGVVTAANIAEACREAGPLGAHVSELAKASSIHPSKLARLLRMLATNHIFTEVSPDVFANNRASSVLDTGKSVKELVANPTNKFHGTTGGAAGVGHVTDEAMKAAAFLQEALLDPKISHSEEPNETALNVAFKTDRTIWDWFDMPENRSRLLRFGYSMEYMKHASPPTAVIEGFDWATLDKNSLVVDVGGGIGAQSMTLARTYPHLRFVVQDREPVVDEAQKFWENGLSGALQSGRVTLQAHDFFATQPIQNAAVFLLRNIMHDWPDKYASVILKQLRSAAAPNTQLIIVDNLLSYACINEQLKSIPGADRPLPPRPLLPNGGHVSFVTFIGDMQMLELCNGKERTIPEFAALMEQTGWKLVRVHQGNASAVGSTKLIGIPA